MWSTNMSLAFGHSLKRIAAGTLGVSCAAEEVFYDELSGPFSKQQVFMPTTTVNT